MKSAKTTLPAYMLRSDMQGCVLGSGTHQLAYAPYGFRENSTESISLGFNGQFRDALSGYYLPGNGQRVYNPALMRFHSPDTLSPFGRGGVNAYMYCSGDPLNNRDPSGHVRVPLARMFPLPDWAGNYITARRSYLNGSLPDPPVRPHVSDRAVGRAHAILKSRARHELEQLPRSLNEEVQGLVNPQVFQRSSSALDPLIKAWGDQMVFRAGMEGVTIPPVSLANYRLGPGASGSGAGHAPSAPPMLSGSRQPSAPPMGFEPSQRPTAPPLSDDMPPAYSALFGIDGLPTYAYVQILRRIRRNGAL